MTILQLKYFLAVCNYQSVSDAATYLFISQPSLSASIKELEKEFKILKPGGILVSLKGLPNEEFAKRMARRGWNRRP